MGIAIPCVQVDMLSFLKEPVSAHVLQATTKIPNCQTAQIFASSSVASVWEAPITTLITLLDCALKTAQLILTETSKPLNASRFVTRVPSVKIFQTNDFV